ncbi:hypothetical protein Tco_0465138 [Tanacetum coccineum]
MIPKTERLQKGPGSPVQYGVSNGLDTAYSGFLGVGTSLKYFRILYDSISGILRIDVSGYGVLVFNSSVVLVIVGTIRRIFMMTRHIGLSNNVPFFLSTTPFDYGVRRAEKLCVIPLTLQNSPNCTSLSNSLPWSVLIDTIIISAFVDSRLESIEQFLHNFIDHPSKTNINNLEFNDESADTPLVSPFPHLDNYSGDSEVLNEMIEYENVGMIRYERAINSFDGDDLAFQCMIGFRKFVAYFDPFLPMNIITCKAYNTIMVEGLESTGKNLVVIVRDVYVFVGSFTYITDFVVLEDIGEFILINKDEVVMGKPFRKITKLKNDCAKGLMPFNRIFDNYTFQMSRTILRFKRWRHVSWSKIPPILVLRQRDLTNGFKNVYKKNKFM